jgi:PPOX class probable F420-dependent enzyme
VTASSAQSKEFAARPVVAVLATTWTRGRIHAVPVWFLYHEGVVKVITERGSQKHRNAVRSGRASLCIPVLDSPERYLTLEGPVSVVDPLSYDQRLAMHVHYRGEEAARRIVDQGGHERMVMLVIHPENRLSDS